MSATIHTLHAEDLSELTLATLYQKRHEAYERCRLASHIPIANAAADLARRYTVEIVRRPLAEVVEAMRVDA